MARQSWRLLQRPDGKTDLVPLDKVDEWLAKHRPAKKTSQLRIKSVERGSWVVRLVDGKPTLIAKHEAPPLERGRGLQVIKDIEPFQNIAVDNAIIGGRRQRRDMMRAHNLIEVGTEPPVNRKQHTPFDTRGFAEDMKQGFRDHGVDVL